MRGPRSAAHRGPTAPRRTVQLMVGPAASPQVLQRILARSLSVRGASRRPGARAGAQPEPSTANRNLFSDTKYVSLHRAEADIKQYCSRVAGPEQAQCLETLEALEARHQEALGKQRDGDQQSAAEAELDRLDALARELSACGNTKLMVDALHHLQHKQTLAAGRDAGDDAATLPAAADDREQRDMRLRSIFDQMDRDGNGKLDIGELRAAMSAIGEQLDGPMVAEIVEAMGIQQGGVAFEDFREIVDAEAVRARTPGAAALRTLLSDSNAASFRTWLNSWH